MAATMMMPMTAIPPTTPPTMAPIGVDLDSGIGVAVGVEVGRTIGVPLGSSPIVYEDTRLDERRTREEDWARVMARKGCVPVWPLKVVRMVFHVVALVLPQAQSSTLTSGYRVPKQ